MVVKFFDENSREKEIRNININQTLKIILMQGRELANMVISLGSTISLLHNPRQAFIFFFMAVCPSVTCSFASDCP